MKTKYDIIIAGSGISGMSLAYYCAGINMKVLVIEKNDTLGGSFTTERTDNYWLELGAHTMYNSYSNLIEIIEGCGMTNDIIKRKKVPYKALKDEKVCSVLSQFSILELLISLPSLFRIKKDNQTVESYYSKIVGRKNYNKFFQYMFNAVPSQPTNDFPANILFKKRKRRKDILKSFTFREGVRSIIEVISDLPEIDALCGNAVTSVTRKNGSFLVTLNKKQYFESEFFALATPVNITAYLTEKLNPDLSQLLTRINHVKTDSVGVIIKKELLEFKEVAGIIGIDTNFYSVVSRDVVEDENHRGFVFHFKPGILEDQAKIDYVCRVLGISEKDVVQSFFTQNTVPSFKVGHESITEEIDKMLQNEKILITGNFISGMAIEDCVSRSKAEFNRLQNFRK